MNIEETGNEERAKSCCPCNDRTRTCRAGHAALVGRAAHNISPTSNEYTLAHSVAGALHCHGGRCRDGPTDSLLPGVRCQTRQLGAQGFWFLFFSFLLPSRRAHAACKRRRTPRVCCGDRAHVHAHDKSGRSRDLLAKRDQQHLRTQGVSCTVISGEINLARAPQPWSWWLATRSS